MSQRTGAPRRPLIAGNWKMHKTSREGAAFVRDLVQELGLVAGGRGEGDGPDLGDREIIVAPPFTGLYEAVAAAAGTGIGVSAQDVFWEAEGPYTGEISPDMLADLGAAGAIIGHSERRQYFAETDASVAKKVRAVLDQGLMPIMCVGETESQREAGRTESVLASQVPAGLAEVETGPAGRLAIAYEPIWAIGTGRTATAAIAQEALAFVRGQVAATLGAEAAEAVRVLYGGSVRPDNIDELMAQPDIDGVLVGGASLEVASFARIVRFRKS